MGFRSLMEWSVAGAFARRTRKGLLKAMKGMGQEVEETKAMARLFFRLLECKLDMENRKTPPTRDEVKEAIEQLKDIGRLSVFTSISLLPGGGLSLIGLELLAQRLGIRHFTFVPSAFRKNRNRAKAGPLDEQELRRQLLELPEGRKEKPGK